MNNNNEELVSYFKIQKEINSVTYETILKNNRFEVYVMYLNF